MKYLLILLWPLASSPGFYAGKFLAELDSREDCEAVAALVEPVYAGQETICQPLPE